ncbi:hypothetical protein SAMN04488137_1624 [Fictibacillus solisalsi]|uniref:Uncharacterized protein n=1 Tax=Fictibacillus solisalsi TaxID=459525 RepID=A0A1G9VJP9_9BACL|nr:hypothetical protein [Fictibacillus solisalsi]SDM72271.1 hypothetical protein SAMN04488137_1624 [Fictibacillus solisalsi]
MIIVNDERIKGFVYDSLEIATKDLEGDEVIITNDSNTYVLIRKVDLEKVRTVGYTKVN